jgi:hypothetical protein
MKILSFLATPSVLALTALAIVFAVPHHEVRAETKEITNGAVASLTGPAMEKGKNWLNGA